MPNTMKPFRTKRPRTETTCARRITRRTLLVHLGFFGTGITAIAAHAADNPGTLGFTAEVDADGFLDPVLKTVSIGEVTAGMPAAAAGISVGHTIVEVEGRKVAGAKAKELQPLMRKQVGEAIQLKLKRPDGSIYSVTLIAAARK